MARIARGRRPAVGRRVSKATALTGPGLLILMFALLRAVEPLGPLVLPEVRWSVPALIVVAGSTRLSYLDPAGRDARRPRLDAVVAVVGGLAVTATLLSSILVIFPRSAGPMADLLLPAAVLLAVTSLDLSRHAFGVAVRRSRLIWFAGILLLSVGMAVRLVLEIGARAAMGAPLVEVAVAVAVVAFVGWCVTIEALLCLKSRREPVAIVLRLIAAVPRTMGRGVRYIVGTR